MTTWYLAADGRLHALADRMDDGLTYTACGGSVYRQRMREEALRPVPYLGACVACCDAVPREQR